MKQKGGPKEGVALGQGKEKVGRVKNWPKDWDAPVERNVGGRWGARKNGHDPHRPKALKWNGCRIIIGEPSIPERLEGENTEEAGSPRNVRDLKRIRSEHRAKR